MKQFTLDSPPFRPISVLLAKQYPIYPVWGILATFIGTGTAIYLVPKDPQPAGQLVASAIAMTIGLSIVPILASFSNLKTILRAEHLLILSPIYWLLLDLLQSSYDLKGLSKLDVENAFIAIAVFVGGIWIAAIFLPQLLPRSLDNAASHILNARLLYKLIWLFFLLAIFKYAYPCNFDIVRMFSYLGENRWTGPWGRGTLGGWDAFLDHLSYFGYLLPTLTVLLGIKTKKISFPLVVAIILSVIMSLFLAQSGSRRVIGVIVGAAIITWTLEQQKLNIKQLFVVLICGSMLLATMQMMVETRGVGVQKYLENYQDTSYKKLHVDDNILRLGQLIQIIPNQHPFVNEKQIVYTMLRPIPRVFWEGKPVDPGFDLPRFLGKTGVSLSSSVIGELYISFGWFSVFVGGWLYGRLGSWMSLLLVGNSGSSASLTYSLGTMALFAGVRSMQDLVLMSYMLLAWIGVSWLLLRRGKQRVRE